MNFGIDLGTLECCIATLDRNGIPMIIRNLADASDTLAAEVYFEDSDHVVIGENAKFMMETAGDRVVRFAKRYLGKADAPSWNMDGNVYGPVEITALILKRLKQIAEESGFTVKDVVITVPAYFGPEERAAVRMAGELAGMNVLNLINDPTAVALSYCSERFQEDQTILVFDLGGCGLDLSIVRTSHNTDAEGCNIPNIRFMASRGIDCLGGVDWDEVLFEHILSSYCSETGLTADGIDPEILDLMQCRVESAKKKLSFADNVKVKIHSDDSPVVIKISREEFECLTRDKVERTMACVEKVLSKYDGPIDQVLLTGGCAHMPMIQRAVETRFPGKVTLYYPDTAVVRGAALYAQNLSDE